jgi:hypothetical protein
VSAAARAIPAWALVSAAVAPVALIGGWTLAAVRQPGHYRPLRQTISALAADGATDRWIMTAGLATLGACHLVTALGLRPARPAGRWLLAVGGVSTLIVAAAPQPAHGSAPVHLVAATVGFAALAGWPLAAARDGGPAPLGRRAGLVATAVLLALFAWLGVEIAGGGLLGLSERLLAGAEAGWPLVAVLLLRGRGTATARMAG